MKYFALIFVLFSREDKFMNLSFVNNHFLPTTGEIQFLIQLAVNPNGIDVYQ